MAYGGYKELCALPPEAYLAWENFATGFDDAPQNADVKERQYAKGLKIGGDYAQVVICANGTWAARGGPGGESRTSSEGIGYHTCTKELLRGFLDSPAEVAVHRWGVDEPTIIKEATPAPGPRR